MGKSNDSKMIGRQFGKLIVVSREGTIGNNAIYKCKCECGNIKNFPTIRLTHKDTPALSCGCTLTRNRYDLVGQKFNKLVVTSFSHSDSKHKFWNCLCKCGNNCIVQGGKLKSNHTKSCGCFRSETMANIATTHSMTKTRIYSIWSSMRQRCDNPKNSAYARYGGRGIKYDTSWNSFEKFYEDMGNPPTEDATLERVKNNKPYSKDNCTWANYSEQALNKRNNRIETYNGITAPITKLARLNNMDPSIVRNRIYAGWTVEEALSVPLGGRR
jgi:hypothetical protein